MKPHRKLKAWRRESALSQAQACVRAGIWQSAWSEIEAGKRTPSIEQGAAIERATNGHVRMTDWLPKCARPNSPSSIPAALDIDATG